MSVPLLSTKLYIPPARPRLVEKIKAGMNLPGSFVLLSGPAGFGKTTLLSELIAQLRQPVGWVSLDEGDNDLRWGSRGFQFERPDDKWRFLRVHIRLVAHSWRVILPNTYLEVAGLIARTDRPVGTHPHSAIYRSPRIVPARKSIKNCSFFQSMSASNTGARSPAGILSVIDRICSRRPAPLGPARRAAKMHYGNIIGKHRNGYDFAHLQVYGDPSAFVTIREMFVPKD